MDTPSGNASTDTVTASTATPVDTAIATPVVEAPKVVEPAEEKLSVGYAKLAHARKQVEAEAAKFAADRAAFEETQKSSASKLAEYEAALKEAKRFPLKFLEKHGLSYQDVTDAQLNAGEPTPNLEVKALKDELETYKAEQANLKAEHEAATKQHAIAQEQAIISKFRADTAAQVTAAGEKFEWTNTYGLQNRVAEVIEAHWNQQVASGEKSPKMLSMQEAAEAVESALEEEAKKIAKTKKFQKFLESKKPAPVAAAPRVAVTPSTPEPKTLTNALTASTTPAKSRLTRQEREKAAIAILQAAQSATH